MIKFPKNILKLAVQQRFRFSNSSDTNDQVNFGFRKVNINEK